MNQEYTSMSLSKEAFADLKRISVEEFGDVLSGGEIDEMGIRLLRLFNILNSETVLSKSSVIEVAERELKALVFIKETVEREDRMPSVRELAKALGFRSSRSGHRMMQRLSERGLFSASSE